MILLARTSGGPDGDKTKEAERKVDSKKFDKDRFSDSPLICFPDF